MSADLVRDVILPALGKGQDPECLLDSAVLARPAGRIAFTTDSYVVRPLEFPGGDIGKLAVCGTVNDLAVSGARPVALSMALVIREGFELELLERLLRSAGQTARQCGLEIATGDTKVVDRSACDGLIVNTAGLGYLSPLARLGPKRIAEGDRIILSGPLGEHALAVMAGRSNLSLSVELKSDCAPLWAPCRDLIERLGAGLKFMRDPTRGGLAATLVELARSSRRDLEIDESLIPVNPSALSAAEILGLDLLTIANEGKLIAVVEAGRADEAVRVLRSHDICRQAAVIGTVGLSVEGDAVVEMVTEVGGRRMVQMPYGEELPRIC